MLVTSWTGLETSLGAIARLRSFLRETKPEDRHSEDEHSPPQWPQKGSVQMENVIAKYK